MFQLEISSDTYRFGLYEPMWTWDLKVLFAQLVDPETNGGALGDGDGFHHWQHLRRHKNVCISDTFCGFTFMHVSKDSLNAKYL